MPPFVKLYSMMNVMNEIEAARAEQQTRGLKAAALRARDACRAAYEFSANSYTFDALLEVEKLLGRLNKAIPRVESVIRSRASSWLGRRRCCNRQHSES